MGKKERGKKRLAELKRLATEHGVTVHEFSRIHVRVTGKVAVDYWPTTGKLWVLGSANTSRGDPGVVIAVANGFSAVVDHETAMSHIRSIVSDETEVPW